MSARLRFSSSSKDSRGFVAPQANSWKQFKWSKKLCSFWVRQFWFWSCSLFDKGWKPALELLLWRSPARQQLEAFWGQDQDSQFQTFCQLCQLCSLCSPVQTAAFVAHPQKPSKYREVPQLFHQQGQIFPKNKFRFKFTLKCDNFAIF